MAMDSDTPSSLETASVQDKQASSEPQQLIVMHEPLSLDFDADDTENPRTWAPKKKVAIGLFVLVSGFVA
jgi:hypothetical protein